MMVNVNGSGMCDKYKCLQNNQNPPNVQTPAAMQSKLTTHVKKQQM